MSTRIQKRRGTAAAWTSANPVLAAGEEGWETDTKKGKTGDGSTAWVDLDYDVVPDVLGTFASRIADATGVAATDTAAVQDAITNKKLLGAGTYVCNPGLVPVNGSGLKGQGRTATTIKLANAANADLFDQTATGITDFQVVGLTLDGNKANQSADCSPAHVNQPVRWLWSYVKVINAYQRGIQLDTDTDSLIFACDVSAGGSTTSTDGAHADIALSACTGTKVMASKSTSSSDCGIANIGACFDCVYDANKVVSPHFIGIALASAGARMAVTNNVVIDAGNNGIDGGNCTDTTIANNVVSGGSVGGIVYDFSPNGATVNANSTIHDNIIKGLTAGFPAIYLIGPTAAVTGFSVHDNQIDSVAGDGVSLVRVAHSAVESNKFHNWGAGYWSIKLDGGSVTTGNLIARNIGWDDRGGPTTRGIEPNNGTAAAGNRYIDNDFSGCPNPFWNTPTATDLARGNVGYNPVGVVVVAVPATTVAVAAQAYDRTFYVTAATGGVTLTIQNGPAVVVPAAGVCAVRVPANKTLTPVFTNAPTWVVEGE